MLSEQRDAAPATTAAKLVTDTHVYVKESKAMRTYTKILAAAVAAALASPATLAAPVTFNPDGIPGGDPNIQLGSFDWNTSSFVAQDGNQAVANFLNNLIDGGSRDTTFTVYTHAVLAATNAPDNTINTPAGLNNNYEITMIAGFREIVTGVVAVGGQNISAFDSRPLDVSFLEIYFDTGMNSDALTGSGFNDGRLILSGSGITFSQGSFGASAPGGVPTVVTLDQTGANDYTGQSTVVGQGSQQNIGIDNLAWDPTFFLTALETFGVNFANISQALPFISIDPSDCFTDQASGAAIGSNVAASGCANAHVNGTYLANGGVAGNGAGTPDYVPVILNALGAAGVNGLVTGSPTAGFAADGPDFVAQTDYNSPLNGVVPEPATLALLGLGLGGLGLSQRRRRV